MTGDPNCLTPTNGTAPVHQRYPRAALIRRTGRPRTGQVRAMCRRTSLDPQGNRRFLVTPAGGSADFASIGSRDDLDYVRATPSFARQTRIVVEESKPTGSLQGSPIGDVLISGHDARFGEDYEAEAFVPHDLPDRVDLPGLVWMAVSEAMTELGRLDAAATLIPNPQLVTRIATRREAVGTSALEGTYADLTELFAAEVLPRAGQDVNVPANVREVMNYTRAASSLSCSSWRKARCVRRCSRSHRGSRSAPTSTETTSSQSASPATGPPESSSSPPLSATNRAPAGPDHATSRSPR